MTKAQQDTLTHLRAAHAAASTLEHSREKALTLTAIEEAGLRVQTVPGELGRKVSPLGE